LFDISADLDTPVSAYLKLKPFRPRFLLESVEGGERLARYSFIGFGDSLEFRLDDSGLRIGSERLPRPANQADLLAALRRALAEAPRPEAGDAAFPLHGGLVGVASYDLVRYFEKLPSHARKDDDSPEAHYVAPRSLLVFDHLTRRAALLHAGPEHERQGLRREIIRALRGGLPGPAWQASFSAAEASLSEDEFMQRVARTQEYIAAGDVYQLVLSVRFKGRCDLDPFETYRALRLLNPSPYMYFCELGDRVVVGSSPEALVKLNGSRATMRPIAGTRPRGADPAQDTALEAELLADPKENAEHVMLVDLARNDIGRVCDFGSVQVKELMTIERYSHVMHIVTQVEGKLSADKTLYDLMRATFPAGTVSGAPKIRAMQIISELEQTTRGPYAGCVGYFSFNGNLDTCITIRTALIKDGKVYVQAGGGWVTDSTPEGEYQETVNKSMAMRKAVAMAQGFARS
jgi:anthranilate synthase component 1